MLFLPQRRQGLSNNMLEVRLEHLPLSFQDEHRLATFNKPIHPNLPFCPLQHCLQDCVYGSLGLAAVSVYHSIIKLFQPGLVGNQILILMFEEDRLFNYFDYQLLKKDFCYSKPLALHFQARNPTTRCLFDQLIEFKSNKCTLTDKIKIQHDFNARHALRITAALNSFKLYYSHQLPPTQTNTERPQQTAQTVQAAQVAPTPQAEVNVYTSVYSDRKLQNAAVQVGFERRSSSTLFNSNITSFIYENKNDYFLYTKLLYLHQKFRIGFLSIFDCSCRNLQTNNLVLQLRPHPKHQVFLRGEVDGLRNYSLNYRRPVNYFDLIAANYLFKPTDSLTLMAEICYDPAKKNVPLMESLIEKRFPNRKLKFRANQLGDIAVQVGLPVGVGRGSVEFGLLVTDILNSRRISYGLKLNINTD